MDNRAAEKHARAKEGGDKITTFFLFGLTLTAVAALTLGCALQKRDTLLPLVPADAVVYVHANGAEAARLAAYAGPAEGAPTEAALYARLTEDGLIEWTRLTAPTDAPRSAAAIANPSLAADRDVARALGTLRAMSSLQAYVQPAAIFSDVLGPDAATLSATVIGASRRAEGFTAILVPVDAAAVRDPLGFRFPSAGVSVATGPLVVPGASAFFGTNLPLSVFDVIFPEPGGRGGTIGAAVEAEVVLRRFLDQTAAAVSVGDQTTLYFSALTPEILAAAINDYVSVAWPSERPLALPDRDLALEFVIDDSITGFGTPTDGINILDAAGGPRLGLVSATNGGAILLLDPDANPASIDLRGPQTADCPSFNGQSFIHMADMTNLLSPLPLGDDISAYFGQISINIQDAGDNMVLICGYSGENVDKVR